MNGTSNRLHVEAYLPKNTGLFYYGSFKSPIDGEYKDVVSPGTGKSITKVAFAGVKDTVAALEAADRAFPAWSATPSIERSKLLRKAGQVIRDHADELAALDAWNVGNPVAIMRQDVEYTADNFDLFAGLLPAVTGDTHHLSEETFNYTIREPLGVIARIVAYNHPVMMLGMKLASAIVVGNTVVLKVAEQAPISALRIMELIGHLFPPGVVNVLAGGKECGATLSSHPIVRKITLVGSVPIGRLIQRAGADTLKLTTFELGGKNALLAYPDADVPQLVEGIVRGMNFAWCGQSCSSTSRIFLHESLYDKVLQLVVDTVRTSYQPGDPLNPETSMGALVDRNALNRVQKYIEIGKSEGATLVLGGVAPDTPRDGFYMMPTIFGDARYDMRIAQEEIFGPVMLYTSNIVTAQKAVRKMQAGYVWVNTVSTHFLGIPFGGYKQSGMGREHGLDELFELTQCKAVHVKLS
ncbi:uncharacterized protein Z520_01802 [Fonsecaea multimorphosa CBS 102226]|uniref:aldehyde dehydrogenase (NAD(+)) n=1 Tax=Fonsecaea multimorphosa CBS 102226 TaxID=1442371 RepID=A0A0D2KEA4_9EURO|nr:uncharacterized protein Z520_01802 [Fonsecaea multimorphosa CBS 102226]KIY01665.1 hypothetical protein Z520_01802 [Fonsecaea multimorphosa CBS 102226]